MLVSGRVGNNNNNQPWSNINLEPYVCPLFLGGLFKQPSKTAGLFIIKTAGSSKGSTSTFSRISYPKATTKKRLPHSPLLMMITALSKGHVMRLWCSFGNIHLINIRWQLGSCRPRPKNNPNLPSNPLKMTLRFFKVG